MTVFECWVGLCEESHAEIWQMEKSDGVRLYMTKTPYMVNYHEFYTTPVYHVWDGDSCYLATTDYLSAYKKYKNLIKGR